MGEPTLRRWTSWKGQVSLSWPFDKEGPFNGVAHDDGHWLPQSAWTHGEGVSPCSQVMHLETLRTEWDDFMKQVPQPNHLRWHYAGDHQRTGGNDENGNPIYVGEELKNPALQKALTSSPHQDD